MAGTLSPSRDTRSLLFQEDSAGVPRPAGPTNPVPQKTAVSGKTVTLLNAATAIGPGAWVALTSIPAVFQATVTGTGTVTAAVAIEVSIDGTNAIDTDPITITLSGTDVDSDGDVLGAPWKWARPNLLSITGTGAAATVEMGL